MNILQIQMMKKRDLSTKNKAWLRLLKNDEEYDFGFLLRIERHKLSNMAKFYETEGCLESASRCASQMRLAVRLLNILIDEDTAEIKVNTKNAFRFISKEQLELRRQIELKKGTVFQFTDNGFIVLSAKEHPYLLEDLRYEKAWALYYKLREQYTRDWWD